MILKKFPSIIQKIARVFKIDVQSSDVNMKNRNFLKSLCLIQKVFYVSLI